MKKSICLLTIKYATLVILLVGITHCNTSTTPSSSNAGNKADSITAKATDSNKPDTTAVTEEVADSIRHAHLNVLKIANQNDPVCGMSMIRGFDDTASYQGKLIGFCSKECRDEFVKKPMAYKMKHN